MWVEILWKYPQEFLGDFFNFRLNDNPSPREEITNLLELKRYQEADKYFRENCILINK